MLFNSYIFIVGFLPVTLIIFFSLSRLHFVRAATAWLAISSLAFYSYWNIAYLPLLLVSVTANYQFGRSISNARLKSKTSRNLLILGLVFNLGLLSYYKYTGFFIASLNQLLNTNWAIPGIILPLGISFYTFTQVAYLVDAYQGKAKNYDFITYVLFATFFPYLISGPILHHSDMISQFHRLRNFCFSHRNMALGLMLFSLGLSKKVLIADNLSPWVALVFNNTSEVSFIEAWVGALSYTFQLYFDFSGYSDMAIALGLMLNIRLPINFNSPYKATSISDFWRRWHITLSNFLRDYLYIPLGGNRHGQFRLYTNLLITMFLGGLWHGAGWTFVIWGGLHGLYLSIYHWWRTLNLPIPKLLAWFITFLAVIISWVVFRANNVHDASELLQAMAGMQGIVLPQILPGDLRAIADFGVQFKPLHALDYLPKFADNKVLSLVALIALVAGVKNLPNTQQLLQAFQPTWWWAIWGAFLTTICLLSFNQVTEFLYFQF